MVQRYIAQDLGGFGRLADMELRLRGEDRADQEASMRKQLQGIQLKQAEMNIAELGRRNKIKTELGMLNKNLPEGENRFTASYKYLMENDPDMADKYMNAQSDRIEDMHKLDPEGSINVFNQTIGKSMGTTLEYVPKAPGKDDIVKATDREGNESWLIKTPKGFEPYDIPKGLTVDEIATEETPTDEKLEYWARQKIKTGKKVFNVRGKYANRMNALIEDRVAQINLEEGMSGEEMAYQQEDIKSIQKSIAAQEKQRGSMVSFVDNLSKQVDHVEKVAEEIKTFDTRLFNKPARWVKRKFVGSPELSKYEVYLGEIQSEIGKLSSGSTASVSELSEGAREKWEGILDENLSIKDMLEVLKEVKEAGKIRMESVDEGLRVSRERLRSVGRKSLSENFGKNKETEVTTQEQFDELPSGAIFIEDGKKYRKP